MTVSFGEGLCCALMACNVLILVGASLMFSEGGGGDNVFDDKLWAQEDCGAGITVSVDGAMSVPPRLMEMKMQKKD